MPTSQLFRLPLDLSCAGFTSDSRSWSPTEHRGGLERGARAQLMAPQMRAVYYRASDGTEPVRDFIDGLAVRHQVLLDNQLDLLNRLTTSDPPLAFPHSSQVRDELRELRCHCGRDLYRVLYRRSVNLFVLLHIFQKNSAAIPEQDIVTAQARWDDFRARMDADPHTPPRPGGHHAPIRP